MAARRRTPALGQNPEAAFEAEREHGSTGRARSSLLVENGLREHSCLERSATSQDHALTCGEQERGASLDSWIR
jgi:hypothetical protein